MTVRGTCSATCMFMGVLSAAAVCDGSMCSQQGGQCPCLWMSARRCCSSGGMAVCVCMGGHVHQQCCSCALAVHAQFSVCLQQQKQERGCMGALVRACPQAALSGMAGLSVGRLVVLGSARLAGWLLWVPEQTPHCWGADCGCGWLVVGARTQGAGRHSVQGNRILLCN